ncbi:MAG: hypothetical protein GY799_23575 [Desulfobulbaceae bacterium]|nr:hypothetical protein [Desulfobulbaceae bacterium]
MYEIEFFYLPAYSPDLNPDEFLNADLKPEYEVVHQPEVNPI